MNKNTKKIAYLGVFLALTLILSYVEAMIPIPYIVPGMKLGLANLAVVCAFYYFGAKEAFIVNLLRIFIIGILFGTGYSLIYSLAGGVLSFIAMITVIRLLNLSVISVSITGGIFHNIGQLIAGAILLHTSFILYYLPVLLVAGAVTGAVIGIVSGIILKRVKLSLADE